MPTLNVAGAELYYETHGEPSNPAVVLVHAGIANIRMWDPTIPALAEHYYVIAYDARGFGKTRSEDVSFSNREDIRNLLNHLGVRSTTLIGNSRGGIIAIDFALENPEQVAGLVLIAAGVSGYWPNSDAAEDALFEEIEAISNAGDFAEAYRRETELWVFGPKRDAGQFPAEFVTEAYELHQANLPRAHEKPQPIPLDPPAVDRLAEIQVPVLSLVGEQDLAECLDTHEYILRSVPQSTGQIISDAAHLLSFEHPESVNPILVNWLDQQQH